MSPSRLHDPSPRKLGLSLEQWLTLFFFGSGAASLAYEVIWIRTLTNFLGSSTTAVTVILTGFMGGLAWGGWWFGKQGDRWGEARLAQVYALLEAGIGGYALLFPLLVEGAQAVHAELYQQFPLLAESRTLVPFFFGVLLLAPPTFLMGGTLPLMSRYLTRTEQVLAVNTARLYSANTFGALTGTLVTGYLLLRFWGQAGTTWIAASLNLLIGLGFWQLQKRLQGSEARVLPPEERREPLSFNGKLIFWSYGLSGAVALGYQVAWNRTLSMLLGTTSYAFTTILATFLLGIAIGSYMYRHLDQRLSARTLYGLLQLILAVSVLLANILMERLPFLYLSLHRELLDTWGGVQVLRFLLAALVMLIPTIAMGMMFPTVCSVLGANTRAPSKEVGRVFGINTFGAMLGAALAGVVLVPGIGMQGTVTLGAVISFSIGLAAQMSHPEWLPAKRLRWAMVTALVASLSLLFNQPWSPRLMSSGVYLYANQYYDSSRSYNLMALERNDVAQAQRSLIWEAAMRKFETVYYEMGPVATVAVMDSAEGKRSLMINGKVDASAGGSGDMPTQTLLASLPMILHPNPERVFVVGLGSGITSGTALLHEPETIITAEISPAVIRAASFFEKYNHGILHDARSTVVARDARSFLISEKEPFDLIISQPSNPWIKGESSLLSLEWYEQVEQSLSSTGMLAQWLPAYHMSPRNLKILIYTLRSVFPQVSLWRSTVPGDLLMIASKQPNFRISYQDVVRRAARPQAAATLQRFGLEPTTFLPQLFLMGDHEVVRYLKTLNPLEQNTDDRLITEFTAPLDMLKDRNVNRFLELPQASKEALKEWVDDLPSTFTPPQPPQDSL